MEPWRLAEVWGIIFVSRFSFFLPEEFMVNVPGAVKGKNKG